jgi:hypothetical protein
MLKNVKVYWSTLPKNVIVWDRANNACLIVREALRRLSYVTSVDNLLLTAQCPDLALT